MKTFLVAVRIWIKAILINVVFAGIIIVFSKNPEDLFFLFFIMIAAFIITAPLLVLIYILIRLATGIPYGFAGKIAWLAFMLSVISILFYVFFGFLVNESLSFEQPEFLVFCLSTIAAILCAVMLSRKSFKTLNYYLRTADAGAVENG